MNFVWYLYAIYLFILCAEINENKNALEFLDSFVDVYLHSIGIYHAYQIEKVIS